MNITHVNSFLVKPEKGVEEQSTVKGTQVTNKENLYGMMERIFLKAPKECKSDIIFLPNEKGGQQNECKTLITNYIQSKDIEDGRLIAQRLQNLTTHRSKLGLLFLVLGEKEDTKRILISRFPADSGILAEEEPDKLTVEFVEKIFMKNSNYYKSAMYEGVSLENDFWTGKAIDKQINTDRSISDYWIKEFLHSDFAVKGIRGTRQFATAIRYAIQKSPSLETKQELIAAVKLAQNLDGNVLSVATLANRLALSEASQNAIKAEMKPVVYEEHFKLKVEELNRIIAYKTIELDNGAILTAVTRNFDEVFKETDGGNGRVTYSTTGKIVNEKVGKRK